MSDNPYESPKCPSPAQQRSADVAIGQFAVAGSAILVLIGCAVIGLSLLPSDAPQSFLVAGVLLMACGVSGALMVWRLRSGGRSVLSRGLVHLFRGLALVLNTILLFQMTLLLLNATLRGPMIIAAPVLVGVPAGLNIALGLLGRGTVSSPRSAD